MFESKPQPELSFKRGEEIEVAQYSDFYEFEKRISLGIFIKGACEPHVVVRRGCEDAFRNGDKFNICNWKHARRILKKVGPEHVGKYIKVWNIPASYPHERKLYAIVNNEYLCYWPESDDVFKIWKHASPIEKEIDNG